MNEDFSKVGTTVNRQPRSELIDYVIQLVRDALYPLTGLERSEVLHRVAVPEVRPSSGEIENMISKAIREQTGKIVAKHINDPNSTISRSLQKNIGADRRRTWPGYPVAVD